MTNPDTIIEIIQVNDFSPSDHKLRGEIFFGLKIRTSQQSITVLINEAASCCEVFDVVLLPFDTDSLIGKTVQKVEWGTTLVHNQPENWDRLREEISTAIVNIYLSEDEKPIQIVAYNSHNGYYPHTVYVEWEGTRDYQEI